MKKRFAALIGAGLLVCSTVPAFASSSPKSSDVTPKKADTTTTDTTTKTNASAATVTEQKSPATGMVDYLPFTAAVCAAGMVVCGLKVKFD